MTPVVVQFDCIAAVLIADAYLTAFILYNNLAVVEGRSGKQLDIASPGVLFAHGSHVPCHCGFFTLLNPVLQLKIMDTLILIFMQIVTNVCPHTGRIKV